MDGWLVIKVTYENIDESEGRGGGEEVGGCEDGCEGGWGWVVGTGIRDMDGWMIKD
jgi:hypothetical protein